jgi:hypothetical protein
LVFTGRCFAKLRPLPENIQGAALNESLLFWLLPFSGVAEKGIGIMIIGKPGLIALMIHRPTGDHYPGLITYWIIELSIGALCFEWAIIARKVKPVSSKWTAARLTG